MSTYQIEKTTYKVSDFLSWQRANTLVLSASFQRRPVWKPPAKSYLMDTIVRGLPIPIIFLRERRSDLTRLEPVREIVDGQQRIRTIISFIAPNLLSDFKPDRDSFTVESTHNKDIAGKTFEQLDENTRLSILDYSFSVHTFPSQVDDREILQIFARINSTGLKLSPQELRNAMYFGEFKTSMYLLASEQLNRWRRWHIFTEDKIARMEEVELTSEFAILMLRGLIGKSQSNLTSLYKEKDAIGTFPERNEIEERYRTVMENLEDRLGSEISFLPFRKLIMFYHLFVITYHLLYGVGSSMRHLKPNSLSNDMVSKLKTAADHIQSKTAPAEAVQAVSRRTTNPSSRKIIFDYFRSSLGEV